MNIKNRIPQEFFVTQGAGESDVDVHTGSYHLALRESGIEMCNIMTYSSILPIDSREIRRQDYRPVHGEVMETISSVATCEGGQTAIAGITYGWLVDRKTDEIVGGLVCERTGNRYDEVQVALHDSLRELHMNGYEHFLLQDVQYRLQEVSPRKKYGTAIVAICFTSFRIRESD